jgi:CRISPR-associated protein Csx10
MTLVPLTIAALGPLAFPERKPGVQFRASLPYVPGAAIYGALGMLLGPYWQGTTDEFAELFRGIRCHNAYPALEGDAWSRPLPMTAIAPKGGAKHASGAGQQPAYADSLYARVCWERQRPAALIYAPTDADGRPWEAAGRTFYTLEDADHQPWRSGDLATARIGTRNVTQRVLTRVAINRRRGTAEDARLYSPLVISEVSEGRDKELTSTRFLGSIAVPASDERTLAALARVSHVGGRQTTGIGAVEIQPLPALSSEESSAALRKRADLMSRRFQEQAELYQTLGGAGWNPGPIFTVNLLSDAILLDQGWLPTNELSGAMLAELTRTYTEQGEVSYPGLSARLIRAFTSTALVGGWNVSWQRPKQSAVATTMGSVFVFQAEGQLSPADYDALARLEQDGIGERRAEGYGQVRICDEFHLLSQLEEA